MDKKLKDHIDQFIEDLVNQKDVKQYLDLKKAIDNSEEIKELKNRLVNAKKALALSFGTKDYDNRKKEYEDIQCQYNSHPLVVNYNVAKSEIEYLLETIKKYFLPTAK